MLTAVSKLLSCLDLCFWAELPYKYSTFYHLVAAVLFILVQLLSAKNKSAALKPNTEVGIELKKNGGIMLHPTA